MRDGPSGPSDRGRFNHNTNDLNTTILHRGYSRNVNLTETAPKSDVRLFGHRFKTTEETYRLFIRYWILVNLATVAVVTKSNSSDICYHTAATLI